MYEYGSASQSIEGESSCVAEHIEHTSSFSVFLKQATVVTLVNEETSLLSTKPVNMELKSVFRSDVIGISSEQIAVFAFASDTINRQSSLGFIVNVVKAVRHNSLQRFCYGHAVKMHANAVCLHHSCASVNINHKSRKHIAFTVNKSE